MSIKIIPSTPSCKLVYIYKNINRTTVMKRNKMYCFHQLIQSNLLITQIINHIITFQVTNLQYTLFLKNIIIYSFTLSLMINC